MRVAVEEAVAEDHRHPRVGEHLGEPAPLLRPVVERVDVGELRAVDVLEREHARPRVRPVDPRNLDVRVAREVLAEGLRVARLEAVVELLSNRAGELVDEPFRVDEVERPDALLREAGGLVHEVEVGLDLARRAGPLHLDGDRAPVREDGAMDLADRGCGHRHRVELAEQPLDRLAETLLDHLRRLLVRERRYVVLEAAELGDDVRRQDVRPHREELAELDEGRAELVEHLP